MDAIDNEVVDPNPATVLITGNPVEGFSYWGPFADADDAQLAAELTHVEADWWLASLVQIDITIPPWRRGPEPSGD